MRERETRNSSGWRRADLAMLRDWLVWILAFSRKRFGAIALAASVTVGALLVSASGAQANFLAKLLREAGEAGGSVARHAGRGADDLGGLSRHLKSLAQEADGVALAAHATPEGHWKFSNRDGEVFTAANPQEMSRVVANLAPGRAGEARLKLYLSEDTVFARPDAIKELPAAAELHLMADGRSYRLVKDTAAGPVGFRAEVKPNLSIRLGERALFDEALWHLGRQMKRSEIRVVALDPGGPQTLSAAPRLETGGKAALVDKIDPWKLPAALPSIRGQTVVVTGRTEGEFLHFRVSGGERSLLVGDLKRAARDADVNLVMLDAADPVQPGGRNWFWQRVEVPGLEQALRKADFADFLDALSQHRQAMVLEPRRGLDGRFGFDVRPSGAAGATGGGITDTLTNWTQEIFSQAVGNIVTSGIKADLRDEERQRELDRRIVRGIPSTIQFFYIAGLVLGVIGLSHARAWWARLWPVEERGEYAGALGYHAARAMRFLGFVLVFLPVVGIPAGVWAMVKGLTEQVWFFVTLPFRLVRWVWRRIVPARG